MTADILLIPPEGILPAGAGKNPEHVSDTEGELPLGYSSLGYSSLGYSPLGYSSLGYSGVYIKSSITERIFKKFMLISSELKTQRFYAS